MKPAYREFLNAFGSAREVPSDGSRRAQTGFDTASAVGVAARRIPSNRRVRVRSSHASGPLRTTRFSRLQRESSSLTKRFWRTSKFSTPTSRARPPTTSGTSVSSDAWANGRTFVRWRRVPSPRSATRRFTSRAWTLGASRTSFWDCLSAARDWTPRRHCGKSRFSRRACPRRYPADAACPTTGQLAGRCANLETARQHAITLRDGPSRVADISRTSAALTNRKRIVLGLQGDVNERDVVIEKQIVSLDGTVSRRSDSSPRRSATWKHGEPGT